MDYKAIVLLSTGDWDNPFWTNKQHVAVELARMGRRVLYIDSLGLRRPSASARDLKRIAKRLCKAVRPPRKVRDNLWVWSPIILPWHDRKSIRKINRMLLSTGLCFWSSVLGFKKSWLWTYNPLTTEFFDLSKFSYRVYHCVDEIKAQPGMPVKLLETSERCLSEQVDIIFTTSPRLQETRGAWNPNTHYFPNVADFDHFNKALNSDLIVPDDLLALPKPRLGFIGAISGYKIDFSLLRHLAESHPEWSVVLIGEVGEGDPWTDSSLLDGLENVHLLGPRSYKNLPAYLKGIDVALLPNHVNEYTDAMFPMKFSEYLAAGCPVVSVDLKALRDFHHIVEVAKTKEDFVSAVEEILSGNVFPLEERLNVAREQTYEVRTKRMLSLIESGETSL
ncbi:glycosyltransferase [Salinicola salarius]|uniref:glycosyltransferase n=1 Tax=Salinicola salarius TaxID=430457 RepID=UPI000DA14203|nr:glycosyltransferase [Salinicola salarius]